MTESDKIFCIIPEKSLKNFIPCKDDYICLGDGDEKGSLTVMEVRISAMVREKYSISR